MFGKVSLVGPAPLLAHDVENAVHDRLPKVGLQRSLVTGLKHVEPAQAGHDGVLHEVGRLQHAARRLRQPPACPPAQGRDTALQQPLERYVIAVPDSIEKIDRRFGTQGVHLTTNGGGL